MEALYSVVTFNGLNNIICLFMPSFVFFIIFTTTKPAIRTQQGFIQGYISAWNYMYSETNNLERKCNPLNVI